MDMAKTFEQAIDEAADEILRDYNEFLKHINVQLKNPSKKYKGKRHYESSSCYGWK